MKIKPKKILASTLVCGIFFPYVGESAIADDLQIKTQPSSIYLVQSQNETESTDWLLNYVPPDYGTPPGSSTQDGARRGGEQCSFSEPLVAMVYSESEIGTGPRPQYAIEPTLQSRPTFWFYVPSSKNNLNINLRVQRRAIGEILYEEDLEFLAEQTGSINGFQLPESSDEFNVGETYRWILQIDCDEDTPPIRISALMERVESEEIGILEGQTNTDNPRERISQLATQKILHDTLSELALLYIESPSEYQVTLDHLLESANMSPLSPVNREKFFLLQ